MSVTIKHVHFVFAYIANRLIINRINKIEEQAVADFDFFYLHLRLFSHYCNFYTRNIVLFSERTQLLFNHPYIIPVGPAWIHSLNLIYTVIILPQEYTFTTKGKHTQRILRIPNN